MVGIQNITAVNITNLTDFGSGNYTDFAVRVNEVIWGGWYFFFMMCVLVIILYMRLNKSPAFQNSVLGKLILSLGSVTVVVILARVIGASIGGSTYYLISDFQMWIFIILTALVGWGIWATKS